MRMAKSDGCLTSLAYQSELASVPDERRFSVGYQEHLKLVSEAAVGRNSSPIKKKNKNNKEKNSMTPLSSRSRSGSVVSLVSMAIPSLVPAAPEVCFLSSPLLINLHLFQLGTLISEITVSFASSLCQQIPVEELNELSLLSGLPKVEVEERYLQFFHLTDGRPQKVRSKIEIFLFEMSNVFNIEQGMSVKQFLDFYRRSFPHHSSPSAPARLGASVFRLMDSNRDGMVTFKEYLLSLCIPGHW